jgi:hypothetical protein
MRNILGIMAFLTTSLFLAFLPHIVSAETPGESSIESRLSLGFQAQESVVQTLLPEPWRVNPSTAGPSKGANLFVAFAQKLLSKTPDGKPFSSGGTERFVVITVPAKHPQTGETCMFVTRVYTTDSSRIPGPYKNAIKADVRRELTLKGENLTPGSGKDDWEMQDTRGGSMVIHIAYERSVLNRVKAEQKIHSSFEPNPYNIYRVDLCSELLKSAPAGIDKLQSYKFHSTIPELSKLLDDNAKLVSITSIPWFDLQVSLP